MPHSITRSLLRIEIQKMLKFDILEFQSFKEWHLWRSQACLGSYFSSDSLCSKSLNVENGPDVPPLRELLWITTGLPQPCPLWSSLPTPDLCRDMDIGLSSQNSIYISTFWKLGITPDLWFFFKGFLVEDGERGRALPRWQWQIPFQSRPSRGPPTTTQTHSACCKLFTYFPGTYSCKECEIWI